MKYGLTVLVAAGMLLFAATTLAAEPDVPKVTKTPDTKSGLPTKNNPALAPPADKPGRLPGAGHVTEKKAKKPDFLDPKGRIRWKRPNPTGTSRKSSSDSSLTSVIVSLVLWGSVLAAVVIGGLWLLKKVFPGTKRLFGSKLLRILGRTHLSPKHSVYLLKVGEKVLVLGVSGDQIRPLSELTDPREVAMMATEGTEEQESNRPGGSFLKFFRRAADSNEELEPPAETSQDTIAVSEATDELDRMRMMVSSWKERYEPPAASACSRTGEEE